MELLKLAEAVEAATTELCAEHDPAPAEMYHTLSKCLSALTAATPHCQGGSGMEADGIVVNMAENAAACLAAAASLLLVSPPATQHVKRCIDSSKAICGAVCSMLRRFAMCMPSVVVARVLNVLLTAVAPLTTGAATTSKVEQALGGAVAAAAAALAPLLDDGGLTRHLLYDVVPPEHVSNATLLFVALTQHTSCATTARCGVLGLALLQQLEAAEEGEVAADAPVPTPIPTLVCQHTLLVAQVTVIPTQPARASARVEASAPSAPAPALRRPAIAKRRRRVVSALDDAATAVGAAAAASGMGGVSTSLLSAPVCASGAVDTLAAGLVFLSAVQGQEGGLDRQRLASIPLLLACRWDPDSVCGFLRLFLAGLLGTTCSEEEGEGEGTGGASQDNTFSPSAQKSVLLLLKAVCADAPAVHLGEGHREEQARANLQLQLLEDSTRSIRQELISVTRDLCLDLCQFEHRDTRMRLLRVLAAVLPPLQVANMLNTWAFEGEGASENRAQLLRTAGRLVGQGGEELHRPVATLLATAALRDPVKKVRLAAVQLLASVHRLPLALRVLPLSVKVSDPHPPIRHAAAEAVASLTLPELHKALGADLRRLTSLLASLVRFALNPAAVLTSGRKGGVQAPLPAGTRQRVADTLVCYLQDCLPGDLPLQEHRQATRLAALVDCFPPSEHHRLFLLLRPILHQVATGGR